jgi:elongation factor 1-beta
MSKYTIADESHLATLDGLLKDNVWVGGLHPSVEDALVLEQFRHANTEPNQDSHLNLWSWFSLVTLFQPHVVESWKHSGEKEDKKDKKEKKEKKEDKEHEDKKEKKDKKDKKEKTEEKVEAKKEEKVEDDMDDLFGPVDQSKVDALNEKKAAEKKKHKPVLIAKSIVVFDVKVWEPLEDDVLSTLAQKIIDNVVMDGLVWKTEFKLEDVAFGVKKIKIGCVIEDEKVSADGIIEILEGWEDEVQSVDIITFNKI